MLTRGLSGLLEAGVSRGVYSGAQCAVANADRVLACARAGRTLPGGGAPVTNTTLFDIASLTKPFTASAALRLVARKDLDLETRLAEMLPELEGMSTATLEQVLSHEAGFESWLPLYERVDPVERGVPGARKLAIDLALAAPPAAAPGERAIYSDLGYIALGEALERVAGRELATLIEDEVTMPLDLASVLPGPVSPRWRAAATEDCPWRGRVLRGEVHDDNAWVMGGLAGHAGLFATATDVARLGGAWLRARREGRWLPAGLSRRATARRSLGRGLGWDLKSPGASSAGSLFSHESFGHLGFTGCSLWVDPRAGISVALLTNRVCFGRDHDAVRAFRPAFHDAVIDLVGG